MITSVSSWRPLIGFPRLTTKANIKGPRSCAKVYSGNKLLTLVFFITRELNIWSLNADISIVEVLRVILIKNYHMPLS